VVLAAALGLCGCADHAGSGASNAPAADAPGATSPAAGGPSERPPFGTGCGAVPGSGPGSFEDMSSAPVATAISHNPALSALSDAIRKANMFDSLNNAPDLTVFAPINGAFQQLPTATRDGILADNAKLSRILTYHVVGRRVAPDELGAGNFPSLEGATLSTSGSGQDFKINGNTAVMCGNVRTANATVYIVDNLLMPPGR
jgi:uncharacterized surface protein with fasciclin (FAS1) repeats